MQWSPFFPELYQALLLVTSRHPSSCKAHLAHVLHEEQNTPELFHASLSITALLLNALLSLTVTKVLSQGWKKKKRLIQRKNIQSNSFLSAYSQSGKSWLPRDSDQMRRRSLIEWTVEAGWEGKQKRPGSDSAGNKNRFSTQMYRSGLTDWLGSTFSERNSDKRLTLQARKHKAAYQHAPDWRCFNTDLKVQSKDRRQWGWWIEGVQGVLGVSTFNVSSLQPPLVLTD